jgi:FixJ family two-component response regulator
MNKGLVLLVDDDPDILGICSMVLQDSDYEVVSYENPREALSAFDKGLRPLTIITDFRMPQMTGLDFLHEVKIRKLRIPTVMFTGVADKELAIRALNAGCLYFIEKPLQQDIFIHHTEQAIRFRRREHVIESLMAECTRLVGLLREQAVAQDRRSSDLDRLVQTLPTDVLGMIHELLESQKVPAGGTALTHEINRAKGIIRELAREFQELNT